MHLQVNCLLMASRRHIYTFQLTGNATESNEKNIFAVLCERLTPLTTFINWWICWINICCFFIKITERQKLIVIYSNFLSTMHGVRDKDVLSPTGHDVIVSPSYSQGALHAIFHEGFWKSYHDFLIVFHSDFLSGMHGFRDNEVLLQAGYDVIVISPLAGVSGDFHDGFWKSDHDSLIAFHSNVLSGMRGFRDNELYCQPEMTSLWFIR